MPNSRAFCFFSHRTMSTGHALASGLLSTGPSIQLPLRCCGRILDSSHPHSILVPWVPHPGREQTLSHSFIQQMCPMVSKTIPSTEITRQGAAACVLGSLQTHQKGDQDLGVS